MDEQFSKEVLKAQDGKKIPLKLESGGPTIGEVTLRYDPEIGLTADMQIDDLQVAEFLTQDPSIDVFKKGN